MSVAHRVTSSGVNSSKFLRLHAHDAVTCQRWSYNPLASGAVILTVLGRRSLHLSVDAAQGIVAAASRTAQSITAGFMVSEMLRYRQASEELAQVPA